MRQQPTQLHIMRSAPQHTHRGGGGGGQLHALAKVDAMWIVAKHALWHDDQERLKIRRKDTLYIYAPHARIHLHMIGGNVNMFNVRACCMCMHASCIETARTRSLSLHHICNVCEVFFVRPVETSTKETYFEKRCIPYICKYVI